MAKYKFIKEYKAEHKIWLTKVGTSSAIFKTETFKVGDIVDGTFVKAHVITGDFAPMNISDGIRIPNPMRGKYGAEYTDLTSTFSIPPENLKLVSSSDVKSTLFSAGNILIAVVSLVIIFGALKFTKVI